MDYWFNYIVRCLFFLFALLLAGCGTSNNYAPVIEGWSQPSAKNGLYVVQKGDTLYSIAWAFGLDYRDLAQINRLSSPYKISPGQHLQMAGPKKPQKKVYKLAKKDNNIHIWMWPANGSVVKKFSLQSNGNKGIDISGSLGSAVKASAEGEVVYSGSGLRGYGKLVIIKHSESFLSAYAYNKNILVKEGQIVKAGQRIATMGQTNSGETMLHFELRYNGKPVNPLRYLG